MTNLEEIVDSFGSAVAIYDLGRREYACNSVWLNLFHEHSANSAKNKVQFTDLLSVLSSYAADQTSRKHIDELRHLDQTQKSNTTDKVIEKNSINSVIRIVSSNDKVVPLAIKYKDDRISFSESFIENQIENRKPDTHLLSSTDGQQINMFRDFLENCDCPGYIRHKNHILFANKAIAILHGFDDVEDFLLNRKLSDHYRPEDRKAVAEVAETEGVVLDTIPQIGKQGQVVHSVAVGSSFVDCGITFRIVLVKDTHSHFHYEDTLKKSEQRFRDIADCSGDWFWDTNADHEITRITSSKNPASNYRLETMIGNTIWQWTDKLHVQGLVADHENSASTIRNIMDSHEPFYDIEVHATNLTTQSKITLLLNAKPMFCDQSMFQGYRGITKDITYQKKLEHSLLEAKQRAEQQSRAKSAFLASMSHEVRTPLTSILGYLELIRREAKTGQTYLDNDQLEQIETIWKSGDQLRSLVNNVLSIERFESGFDRIDLATTDLNQVLLETKQTFALAAAINSTSLVFSPHDSTPSAFNTDPVKLRQILHNIVGNATKFTIDGEIRIATSCVDKTFIILVKDTGIGISNKQLDSIREAIGTTDISENLARGGGLGLVLCQHYVSQLGGELKIRSQLDKGTSVEIHLPDKLRDDDGVKPASIGITPQPYYQPAIRPQSR